MTEMAGKTAAVAPAATPLWQAAEFVAIAHRTPTLAPRKNAELLPSKKRMSLGSDGTEFEGQRSKVTRSEPASTHCWALVRKTSKVLLRGEFGAGTSTYRGPIAGS